MEELSDRKMQILQAIILNYLQTAEPVGSRTISRQSSLGLSSATIRNEMQDLEEMGLIEQPHTSAGRIPSSKGYRMYVNHLLSTGRKPSQAEISALNTLLSNHSHQLDSVLKEMGQIMSLLTSYPTVVTMPTVKKTKLKRIQLVPLDERSVIVVVVTDGNVVRNQIIRIPHPLSQKEHERVSYVLNYHLHGLTIEEINLPLIQLIRQELGSDQSIVGDVLDAIQSTFKYADDVEMYASGMTNLLDYPEFNDINRVRSLLDTFEKKDEMLATIGSPVHSDQEETFHITIGAENQNASMQDCSVVTTTIQVGGRKVGTISVIGPVRMDYDKVFTSLGSLLANLKDLRSREEQQNVRQLPMMKDGTDR